MSPENAREEPLPRLAPDEESPVGWGGGDPAALLGLFNPTGGAPALPLAPEASLAPAAAAAQVAELVERWVKRVALGGDARRGVARLDIGQGRYAGAELTVSAEADRVSVELTLPDGAGDTGLSERLRSRLARRGLNVDVVVR
jgi:hypothetical protein